MTKQEEIPRYYMVVPVNPPAPGTKHQAATIYFDWEDAQKANINPNCRILKVCFEEEYRFQLQKVA
jgi:hypothetical protein